MALETLQHGRYRMIRSLGSGSMGEVYLFRDTRIDREVAIKVIRTEANPYPGSLEQTRDASRLFEREARAIARLDHPNILALYDFGEETLNGEPLAFMVMPYCPDGSLSSWLQQRGSPTLSPQEVAHFVQQAASALQYAHEKGIIHQDVKPQNFLIRRKSSAALPDLLLADFGIARLTAGTSSSSQAIRGTPVYMAPEQWEGQPLPASDQYSLAIMAYQLLTGRTPFQGGPSQMMFQHFNMSPMPPSAINPSLSPEMDTVMLTALAKRPDARYPSISAFADAFQQAVMIGASTIVRPNSGAMTGSTWMPQPSVSSMPTTFDTSSPTVLQSEGRASVSGIPTVLHDSGQFGNPPVAYPMPGTGSGPQPPAPPQRPQQRTSRGLAIAILIVVLLLIIGSIGGALYYFQSASAANNANATATANANNTSTANNGLTSTAQNNLTATGIANFNATSTANANNQSNANATATANSASATQTATTQNNINQNATATAVAATATVTATPFTVQSVTLTVDPKDISGDTCGTMITVTWTATFTVSDSPGGTVQFSYTTDNGQSQTNATLTFAAGQTTQQYKFSQTGQLSQGGTFPGTGNVLVTSPNSYTAQGVQPTGQCQP
jgi:eukaryotic-like serine/threonine-protein kinase